MTRHLRSTEVAGPGDPQSEQDNLETIMDVRNDSETKKLSKEKKSIWGISKFFRLL